SSITKSEPTGRPAGPHDLAFDEFSIGERTPVNIKTTMKRVGNHPQQMTKRGKIKDIRLTIRD
ncbi:hypothetical protein CTU84_25480, partial [Escherichia coli]